MGMRGPAPKPAATRQRRNRVSTATTLVLAHRARVPKLPPRPDGAWHAMTVGWWRDIWRSPMAAEFVQADIHGLYRLAVLVDAFWEEPSVKLHAEIRAGSQCYGLTPIDRRRLQWEVQRVEGVEATRPARPRADPNVDPRDVLQVVS